MITFVDRFSCQIEIIRHAHLISKLENDHKYHSFEESSAVWEKLVEKNKLGSAFYQQALELFTCSSYKVERDIHSEGYIDNF